MNPNKLLRFYTLLLPFLLLLSDFQVAYAQTTHAVNLSTRMFVRTGDEVAIAGFIITGRAPPLKRVFIQAHGQPSNPFLGLPSPLLELHDSNGRISSANPTDIMLAPGNYTAIVKDAGSGTGLALVEIYDLDPITPTPPSKLGNISTRAFVQTGENIVIAGFILSNGSGNGNIVVRGIGPSLSDFGVPNPLADPTLELRNSSGTKIAANDNWVRGSIPENLEPAYELESALAAPSLAPGQYTALLAGVNNTTGIGVVEIYDLGL